MKFKLKEGLQAAGGVVAAGVVLSVVLAEAGIDAIKRMKAADENDLHPGRVVTNFETARWIHQEKNQRTGVAPPARTALEPLPEPIPINERGGLIRSPRDPRYTPIKLDKS